MLSGGENHLLLDRDGQAEARARTSDDRKIDSHRLDDLQGLHRSRRLRPRGCIMFVKSNRGWLLLAHIPYRGEHFDEYFGLRDDSRDNQRKAKKIKRALADAIRDGTFESE